MTQRRRHNTGRRWQSTETTPQFRETMAEHRDDATVQGDDDRAQRRHHNSKRITEHRDVAIVQA